MRIRTSSLSGEITVPPSKSETMRALIFALLARGKTTLFHLLPSPDTTAMLQACRLLGATIIEKPDSLEIVGALSPAENVIDAGNSGLVLRFIAAAASLLPTYTVITGDASIRHRRLIQPLIDGLNQLGAWSVSTRCDGHAPLVVRGILKGGKAEVEGRDSQPISALLIASAFAEAGVELTVRHPGETAWVNLTLSWFDRLGIRYEHRNFSHYCVLGGHSIDGFTYTIPGDWSSALYPIAAALMTDSELTVRGVDSQSAQGDKGVVSLLQSLGAKISITETAVHVSRGPPLQGGSIHADAFIDAITLLPVLACRALRPTHIHGAEITRFKESDRIAAIVAELKKMGAKIEERADGMVVEPAPLHAARVDCHSDHRMALALSVAALGAEGETELVGAEVVAKSFPAYFDALRSLGADLD